MTTESKQDTRLQLSRLGGSPLLGAAAASLVLVAGLTAVATGVDGRPGLVGAACGGGLALLVFVGSTAVVQAVASTMPSASLLVALLTYTLQVVLMALVVVALQGSGLVGESLSRGWFAATLIAVAVVWMAAQMWLSTRVRILAYDLPETGHPGGEG